MFFTEWQIFVLCIYIIVIIAIHVVNLRRKTEPYGFLETINLLLMIVLCLVLVAKFAIVKIS